ncbi:17661_t:CDS:2 [Funneliformis geosporum]|uniref:19518_t:CDS:1 n=1 Tax=Funneliformis geosporum TaxID=1117311 RepID=A0A9W4SW09_9GLOM|nr:17661_t:CDS:2 [Funneliformis geosporum]CAI2181158.1 19518_t:CDS:2 [Funneliformis geosporum]
MAGWLIPVITIIVAIMLGGAASLFLCETLSAVPGNNKFQKQVEFSHLSSLIVPNRHHKRLVQTGLFISMQSINIASIILSSQTMDSLVISIIGRTCGVGIHPDTGFFCVNEHKAEGSPFEERYMFITAGYLIALCITVPLGIMDLVENIKVQIISLMTLITIIVTWLVTFSIHGLNTELVPMVGYDKSQVIGTVLFNYAFIITVPSWVNDVNPSVPIRKAVWYSLIISTVIYLLLGIMGGMAYKMESTSNIISTINESSEKSIISVITTYLFPLAVLITSIPVYTIIIRYNLIRTGYCGKVMANLLSCALPWVIIIPFQTGFWLNAFMNWTSLIFNSSCNFILPFYLYYVTIKGTHLRNDPEIIKIEMGDEKHVMETERKKSYMPPSPNQNHLLPPPQLLENNPIRKESHESFRSTRSSLSIRTYHSSPKVSPRISPKVSPRIMPENHPERNYFDMVVMNVIPTTTSAQHELETRQYNNNIPSPNHLDIPTPQLVLNGNRGAPCSTPGGIRSHTTMTAGSTMIYHQTIDKHHLSAPPSLISRNSLKRGRSPQRHVVTPIITLNHNGQLDSNVDPLDFYFRQKFRHHHQPSLVSSDNNLNNQKDKVELFKAFPWISNINGMKIAIGLGTLSIMLIGGVIAYDFILLATGTNVFGIYRNTS